jgi:nucleoside-diphosphate-sugar epimerase
VRVNIVITGNMGYIGPVVVAHLRRRFPEAKLIGYDAGFFAHCLTTSGSLPECLLDAQYFGDVRDFPLDLLRGVDAVIHLAAVSNDPIGNKFEKATAEINRDASIRLLRQAIDADVRNFVFASSCSVYGFAEGGPRREEDTLNPLTAYARSKIEAEQAFTSLANERITITCLRFATACGWSGRLRLDLVLNDFVACAMTSGEISILSDGTPWRPLIDVADMARATEWAVARNAENGGRVLFVNVGADPWNYRVRDLADAVASEFENTKVQVNPNAVPDKRSYRVDFALFRALAPLHQPRVDLVESIRSLRRGLQDIAFRDRGFRHSRQVRLQVLNTLTDEGSLSSGLRWTWPTGRLGEERGCR